MSSRLKTFLLMSGFTIACASCASMCGEEEQAPHALNVSNRPGSTAMTKPRILMTRDGFQGDAGAVPDAH